MGPGRPGPCPLAPWLILSTFASAHPLTYLWTREGVRSAGSTPPDLAWPWALESETPTRDVQRDRVWSPPSICAT